MSERHEPDDGGAGTDDEGAKPDDEGIEPHDEATVDERATSTDGVEADDPAESVFERDDHTCVRCEEEGDEDIELSLYPVTGGEPEEQPSEALVTVCASCRGRLDGTPPAWLARSSADLAGSVLEALREVTSSQGEAVATVADFAAVATLGIEPDDPEARSNYLTGRREAHLAVAFTDRSLEAAAELDIDGEPATGFADVRELAASLQEDLHQVLEWAETAVAAADQCPACLESIETSERCGSCGYVIPETTTWRDDDGSFSFVSLYGAVNERLQNASGTTTRLTGETARLAGLVANDR